MRIDFAIRRNISCLEKTTIWCLLMFFLYSLQFLLYSPFKLLLFGFLTMTHYRIEPPSLLMSLLTFCISACLSTTNFTEAIKHLLVPNLRSRHGLPSVSFHGQSGHGRSEAKSIIHLPRPTELLEKKMSTLCVPL